MINAIKGKPQQAERVTVAVESSLETLIIEHAEAAAERAEAAWRSLAPGQELLSDVGEDLGRASRGLRKPGRAGRPRVAAGRARDGPHRGPDKRTTARFLAYGVNGLAVSLMVVVFASTAGITGAEVGIAGGSALLGQKLLEAVFGDQALRSLAERARAASSRSACARCSTRSATATSTCSPVSRSSRRRPTASATRPVRSTTCATPTPSDSMHSTALRATADARPTTLGDDRSRECREGAE